MKFKKLEIHRINKFFKRIGAFQIRFRWSLIIIAILLTVFGITGLRQIEVANSRDDWFDDSEAIEIATEKFEEQFGNNDNISILIESKNVFDQDVLKAIERLGKELLDKIPYADEITSLVELEISVGTKEGIDVKNPFENGIPEDPGKIKEIKELVLSRKALVNKIVSDDCTETWLTLSLREYPEKEEWEKETDKDPMFQVGEAAISIITDPKWKSDKYTLKPAGLPYTETEERDFFGPEMMKRVLSGFVVMIILLSIFVRSFKGVFVPIFATVAGIVIVFGGMGWTGISVDYNMMSLPVLLGMALSVGYSIHLINAFKRNFNSGMNRRESVLTAVEETGWPIFFTALTTIGSVLSFVSAGIITIQWVGFTSAAVILTDYILIMVLIPVLMSFGKENKTTSENTTDKFISEKYLEGIGSFVLKKKAAILIVFAVFVISIAPGIFKMSVNIDSFKFMGVKIPYMQRLHEIVNSQLGSYLTYNITVDFNKPGAIKDPAVLKEFDSLLNTVGAFELTKKNKDASSVFSILDIVKEMNQTLHGDKSEYHAVPDTRELVAQVLFLYEMSGGTKTFKWIDEDYSMLRAQVQVVKFDANEVVRELNTIKQIGKTKFRDAKISIVGSAVQFAELNKKIVTGEIKSIFLALIIIATMMILVFGSFKIGLIGMIPNMTPLILIAGYMGYFDSTLDMMTMTIIPMLLGIAVDDTIHFINHIKYEYEKSLDYEAAILASFKTVGKNITMTTVILAAAFAMYLFSPVSNMIRIGFLASMGLVAALVTDFLVTPALILLTKPFDEKLYIPGEQLEKSN